MGRVKMVQPVRLFSAAKRNFECQSTHHTSLEWVNLSCVFMY